MENFREKYLVKAQSMNKDKKDKLHTELAWLGVLADNPNLLDGLQRVVWFYKHKHTIEELINKLDEKSLREAFCISSSENQSPSEESLQALERLSSKHLSDLCVEPTRTDCHCHPCLEIQPNCIPDWQPILHK